MSDEVQKSAPRRASSQKSPPARTPEAEEREMINLAMKQARKQLENGTASSQIVTHFLNLATQKAQLERDKLRAETEMAKAKVEVMQSQKKSEELYKKAIDAFKSYGGGLGSISDSDEDEDDYYDE